MSERNDPRREREVGYRLEHFVLSLFHLEFVVEIFALLLFLKELGFGGLEVGRQVVNTLLEAVTKGLKRFKLHCAFLVGGGQSRAFFCDLNKFARKVVLLTSEIVELLLVELASVFEIGSDALSDAKKTKRRNEWMRRKEANKIERKTDL
jgi:hypothetical protein